MFAVDLRVDGFPLVGDVDRGVRRDAAHAAGQQYLELLDETNVFRESVLYFEPPGLVRRRREGPATGVRVEHLVSKSWNGLANA
jgi:hypothetical protein